jgi:hypothetical protein
MRKDIKEKMKKLKKAIEEINKMMEIKKMQKTRTCNVEQQYQSNVDRIRTEKELHVGLLAEDVRKALPLRDIAESDKGYSPGGLVPILIKAIQELNDRIDKLEKPK